MVGLSFKVKYFDLEHVPILNKGIYILEAVSLKTDGIS